MDSFINLMGNDVWSEADIKARLHAELRGAISDYAETELKRALFAKSELGRPLTVAENTLLVQFATAEHRVALLGVQARADAILLSATFQVDAARQRLERPAVLPVLAPPEAVDESAEAVQADTAERDAAQGVVDAASPEALALSLLRNPAPEVTAPVEVAS